ncbi:hypothetical protein PI124_g13550 [Phytophthora idaei]|nr:hypothetical protein PI124_g13550 [Phytophthora idaei]
MADLLNPTENDEGVVEYSVVEHGNLGDSPDGSEREDRRFEYKFGELEDGQDGLEEEAAGGNAEEVTEAPASAVDVFGLDREQFLTEQQEVVWIRALVAFLTDGALPIDPLTRSQVVKIAPKHSVGNDMLLRAVHLPTRVGPARSLTVSDVPLPYVPTVLHYCHSNLLPSHLGLAKTLEKVRRHAYWTGWRKDVAECLQGRNKCGSGKGSGPWSAGQMQRMPVADLTGPFSMLAVDAVGPLRLTSRGNRYILVFVDCLTRWAETSAVERQDSVTFVDVMVNGVIARHGY